MIITKTDIVKICAQEDDRPVLAGVHYNAHKKRLEASDGFILAVAPVEGVEIWEEEHSRIVPKEAVIAAQKAGRRKTPARLLLQEDGARVPFKDGELFEYVEGTFPDVDKIIPPRSEIEYIGSIDADKLYRLALALCDDKKALYVSMYRRPVSLNKSEPVLVIPIAHDWKGKLGVVMPMYIPTEKRGATTAEIEEEIMCAGYELTLSMVGDRYLARATCDAYDINVSASADTRQKAIRGLRGALHSLDVSRGKSAREMALWKPWQGNKS